MNFLFAWRYFKAKKSTNAINIIAWVSILAFIFGTMILILVLSVFNGFEGIVKDLYSTFYTDIKITPVQGKVMTLTPGQLADLKKLPGVKNYSLVAEEKALLQNGDYQSVIYLKGVDDNYRYVSGVADNLINDSKYDIGSADVPKLILGVGVEDALGIISGLDPNNLNIYLPRKSSTTMVDITEDISSDTISSSAAFRIQQDFDNKYGITNIGFVKAAMKLNPDEYTAAEISLVDADASAAIKRKIKELLGNTYLVQNKYEQNRSLYAVMNAERWIIYGVLCLVLVVAAFTMIGSLTMLVLEKQKDISILHALGGNRLFIRKIFLTEGMLLALVGGGIGMLLAFIVAQLQIYFHFIPLQGGTFLIDYYPVKLKLADFLLVSITVFVIALVAAWLPSGRAAGQQFSLRSE
ncbi:MAG: ABC transporter permease [Chitinophagaceae bacterium]|nr:ABC transporter permease [Chitinophagaceae bacterium]MBK8953109.1 ABC transporter permease [Chitinophagaceae bacterium]